MVDYASIGAPRINLMSEMVATKQACPCSMLDNHAFRELQRRTRA
jgi:hypothetical protein